MNSHGFRTVSPGNSPKSLVLRVARTVLSRHGGAADESALTGAGSCYMEAGGQSRHRGAHWRNVSIEGLVHIVIEPPSQYGARRRVATLGQQHTEFELMNGDGRHVAQAVVDSGHAGRTPGSARQEWISRLSETTTVVGELHHSKAAGLAGSPGLGNSTSSLPMPDVLHSMSAKCSLSLVSSR